MNEAQKMLWDVLTEPRTCWDCGKKKMLTHIKFVKARRWAGYLWTCDDCYKGALDAQASASVQSEDNLKD